MTDSPHGTGRFRRSLRRRRQAQPRVVDLLVAGPARGKSHRLFTEASIAICNNVDVRVWAPRGWPGESPEHFPVFVDALEQSPPKAGLVVVDALDYLYLSTPYTLPEARTWIGRLAAHATEHRYTVLAAVSHLTPHLHELFPAVATMSIESDSLTPSSLPSVRLSLNRWLTAAHVDQIDFRGSATASAGSVMVLDAAGSTHWSPPVAADIVSSVAPESDISADELATMIGGCGTRVTMGHAGAGIPLHVIRRAAAWQNVDLPAHRRILLDRAGFEPSEALTYKCTSLDDADLARLEGYRDEIDGF